MKRANDTLYDLIDSKTNETATYEKVTSFIDGTPMNDSKCDGVMYRKLGGEYFAKNYTGAVKAKWFGVIADGVTDNTIAIIRALSYLNARQGGILQFEKGTVVTDGFILPPRVKLQGERLTNTRLQMLTGSTKSIFIDCTDAFSSSIKDLCLNGILTGAVDGLNITATNMSPSVHQLRIDNVLIQNFSRDGIHSTYGAGAFTFEIKNYEIFNCSRYAVFNTSSDNAFHDGNILSCKGGGIYNEGPNTRFRGGKIIFCGESNPNSGGIVDKSSRSQFSNIELQENYYHGLVVDGATNCEYSIISDMNNVARRPVGPEGGLGIVDAIGYGVRIVNGANNNRIVGQVTSARPLSSPSNTQYPYSIGGDTFNNTINLKVGAHNQAGINGAIKRNRLTLEDYFADGFIDGDSWKVIGICKYEGVIDGLFRYRNIEIEVKYGSNLGNGFLKTGTVQCEFRLTTDTAILDIANLHLTNVTADIIRLVKKGVNNYEIQLRNLPSSPTYYAVLGDVNTGVNTNKQYFFRDYRTALVGDTAFRDITNFSTPNMGNNTFTVDTSLSLANYGMYRDAVFFLSAAAGDITITLPSASVIRGFNTSFIRVDGTSNKVFIKGNGIELIQGLNSYNQLVRQYSSVTLESNGTSLFVKSKSDTDDIVNNSTTPPTKSILNTAYPNAKIGFMVSFPLATGGAVDFKKIDNSSSGDWLKFSGTLTA
jgi:hypothetical protein